jgi:hypothetical protein
VYKKSSKDWNKLESSLLRRQGWPRMIAGHQIFERVRPEIDAINYLE